MIGWWIVIAAQTPEERDAAIDRKADVLANWETSVGGSRWVQKLVDAGKATQLLSEGYPNRYTTKAGDDYVMPGDWAGNVILHRDKIAACLPDKVLTIEVWDQS